MNENVDFNRDISSHSHGVEVYRIYANDKPVEKNIVKQQHESNYIHRHQMSEPTKVYKQPKKTGNRKTVTIISIILMILGSVLFVSFFAYAFFSGYFQLWIDMYLTY